MTKNKKGSLIAERTLKALMLFSKDKYLSVADIALHLDISLTSAYRIMESMDEIGFIEKNHTKRYTLRPQNILQLYNMLEQGLMLASAPVLEKLVSYLQESVYLSVIVDEKNYSFISQRESPLDLKWTGKLGEVNPIPVGTAGKTHLAYLIKDLNKTEKDLFISSLQLNKYTQNTITSHNKLKKSIEEILETGYCLTKGEHIEGVVGIAVPVFNFDKTKSIAVLGVHMVASRYNEEKLEKYVDALKGGSEQISNKVF